jgi:hypothetical protein
MSCTECHPNWARNVETNKQNFIYHYKKNMAFLAQILMKLTVVQQQYVQISYTKFTKIVL